MTDLPSTPREALEAAAQCVEASRLAGGRSSLEAFKATKKEIAYAIRAIPVAEPYPTEDAYMAACRALLWRTAQLCANYIEPVRIPDGAPQYPPDGFDFGIAAPTLDPLTARLVEALEEIADMTKRKQLPLTNMINDTARAALAAAEGRG